MTHLIEGHSSYDPLQNQQFKTLEEDDRWKNASQSQRLNLLRWYIVDTAQQQRVEEKFLRIDGFERLEHLYNEMKHHHETQAWNHTINLVGAFLSIAAAGFDQNGRVSQVLSGVGRGAGEFGGFLNKFTDAELKKLEGYLEELRDGLKDNERTNDQLLDIIKKIEQMVDEAMRRQGEATAACIRGG